MKKTLSVLLLSLFVASGINLCAAPGNNPAVNPLKISISLPTEALVTDDLDARDEFNRPIHAIAVKKQFENLWDHSLNRMLLEALTPARAHMLAVMNALFDAFASFLQTAFPKTLDRVCAWIQTHSTGWRLKRLGSSNFVMRPVSTSSPVDAGNSFLFLIRFVISSTRLLR